MERDITICARPVIGHVATRTGSYLPAASHTTQLLWPTRVKVTLNKGYNEEEGRVAEFAERDMTTGLHQFSVYKSEVCVAQAVPDV